VAEVDLIVYYFSGGGIGGMCETYCTFVLAFVGWAIESSAMMGACIERFVSCIDGIERYPIIRGEFGGKQKCRIPRDGRKVIGIILHFNYSIQNMAYYWGYSWSS